MALTCLVDSGVVTLGLGRPLALGPAGKIRLTREMWRGPDELANPFLPIFLFLLFYWPLLFRLLLLFHLFHLLRHLLLLPTFPFTHALMRILKCSWFDRLIHICRHILASFQAGDDRDPLQGSIPAGFLRGGEAEDGIERGGRRGGNHLAYLWEMWWMKATGLRAHSRHFPFKSIPPDSPCFIIFGLVFLLLFLGAIHLL